MTEHATIKLPRGDQTRENLLVAAMEIFARDGFHAASTRTIARSANANQALIGYHFGGKKGLYLAVFSHIADEIQATVAPIAKDVEAGIKRIISRSQESRLEALAMMQTMFGVFLRLFTRPESRTWALLFMRESQDPGDGFEIIYREVLEQMVTQCSQLVEILDGETDSDVNKMRTISLIGQVLVFVTDRGTANRFLGVIEMTVDQLEVLKEVINQNLARQFNLETPA